MIDFQSESFISHITVNGLKKTNKDRNNGNLDLIDFFSIFMLTALTFYILIEMYCILHNVSSIALLLSDVMTSMSIFG